MSSVSQSGAEWAILHRHMLKMKDGELDKTTVRGLVPEKVGQKPTERKVKPFSTCD